MESVLVAICDNSMTCVGSTIETCTNIVVFRENVDKFSFSFVAPLRAEDDGELRLLACDASLSIFAD